MAQALTGAVVFTAREAEASEYLPNRGVFLAGMLGKARGDGFGLYFGRIEPGSRIAEELHPETSETVYVLSGEAVGVVGDQRIPLAPGQVLHIDKNVPHGLENSGDVLLEFLVIGHPDF
jgi:mannose-6-phosphate isomerase-like protein (cupin superfamily)